MDTQPICEQKPVIILEMAPALARGRPTVKGASYPSSIIHMIPKKYDPAAPINQDKSPERLQIQRVIFFKDIRLIPKNIVVALWFPVLFGFLLAESLDLCPDQGQPRQICRSPTAHE